MEGQFVQTGFKVMPPKLKYCARQCNECKFLTNKK